MSILYLCLCNLLGTQLLLLKQPHASDVVTLALVALMRVSGCMLMFGRFASGARSRCKRVTTSAKPCKQLEPARQPHIICMFFAEASA